MSWNDISDDCLVRFLRGIARVTFLVSASGYSIDIDEWTKLTGQTREEIRGLGWIGALHKDDAARAEAAWQTAITHGTSYNTDYRIRCTDGIYRWFNARAEPVFNEDGRIIHWVGAILAIAGSNRFNTKDMIGDNFEDIRPAALRAARAMLNWSAERLAEEAGISRSTIRRLESDHSHVSARRSNIIRILDAFQAAGLILIGERGVVTGVSEDAMHLSEASPV
ncbi:PAS domain-containing protein [Altericroceibacterium indicum]|nr:PAS domain-containing protein [Altericroceibacterium indicum]